MWLLVAPRAAKVLMVMRASGSSRPILASTPRNGVVRGSQPETTARKSSRRLTRRCPVALQLAENPHEPIERADGGRATARPPPTLQQDLGEKRLRGFRRAVFYFLAAFCGEFRRTCPRL